MEQNNYLECMIYGGTLLGIVGAIYMVVRTIHDAPPDFQKDQKASKLEQTAEQSSNSLSSKEKDRKNIYK